MGATAGLNRNRIESGHAMAHTEHPATARETAIIYVCAECWRARVFLVRYARVNMLGWEDTRPRKPNIMRAGGRTVSVVCMCV